MDLEEERGRPLGLTAVSLLAAYAALTTASALLWWLGAAAAVTIAAVFLLRALGGAQGPLPEMCRCYSSWRSLDSRWGRVRADFRALVAEAEAAEVALPPPGESSGWLRISALLASVGALLGWAAGVPHLRLPGDGAHYARMNVNFAEAGCIYGPRALVGVVRGPGPGEAPPGAEKWCPTRAAQGGRPAFYCAAETPGEV